MDGQGGTVEEEEWRQSAHTPTGERTGLIIGNIGNGQGALPAGPPPAEAILRFTQPDTGMRVTGETGEATVRPSLGGD